MQVLIFKLAFNFALFGYSWFARDVTKNLLMLQSSGCHMSWNSGPGCSKSDNFSQRIDPYPADKIGAFLILIGRAKFYHLVGIYMLDKVIQSSYNWALLLYKYISEENLD